jgi:hypothetical protein
LSVRTRELSTALSEDDTPSAAAAASLVALLLALRDTPDRPITVGARGLAARATASELQERPAAPLSDDPVYRREVALLEPTLHAYERYFGAAPRVCRMAGAEVEAYQLVFPDFLRDDELFFRPLHALCHRQALAGPIAELGFGVHDDGLVRTVPTPESLRRLVKRQGLFGQGLRPELLPTDELNIDAADWLEHFLSGTLQLRVGTRALFVRHAPLLALRTPDATWSRLLTGLGSDLGRRMLLTHRLPQSAVVELGARIAPALARAKRDGRRQALEPLLALVQEDLVNLCAELWLQVAVPSDFAALFAGARPQFRRAIDARLRELELALRAPRRRTERLEQFEQLAPALELGAASVSETWGRARGVVRRLLGRQRD